jgi:predicted dehydrogenase
MNRIRSIVVGLGNVGLNYDDNNKQTIFTHCKSLYKHKKYNLLGAADINSKQLNKFSSTYNLPGYLDVEEALKDLKPEFVTIAVPTDYHLNVFNKIIKYPDIKYILLEKPGTYSAKDLNKIFSVSKKKRIKVFINYPRLFDNYFINIAKKIAKSKNLQIFIFYNRGIFNNCCHYLSFLNLFIKKINNIRILNIYNSFNKDPQADFFITSGKADIYFFKNKTNRLSQYEIIINSEKGSWHSINNFSEFNFSRTKRDPYLMSYDFYSNSKTLKNKNKLISQYLVYDKIYALIKNNNPNFKNNFIWTLEIINKIILKI